MPITQEQLNNCTSTYNPECEHDWENGQCINCGQYHEEEDFSGASEDGDR